MPHAYVLTSVGGGNALSPFRAAALVTKLRTVAPSITDVSARYVHWAASDAELDASTHATVERLLTYGPAAGPVASVSERPLLYQRGTATFQPAVSAPAAGDRVLAARWINLRN